MGRHVLFYLCIQLEVLYREVVVVSSIIGFDLWDAMYCSISVFYYGLLFREDVGLGSGVSGLVYIGLYWPGCIAIHLCSPRNTIYKGCRCI